MKYQNILEEELKNKVGQDWFDDFDTTKIVGKIDFCVAPKHSLSVEETHLLWAEAKKGTFDMLSMMVQLVLTIGKSRSFDKIMPPKYLGAFDSNKIGFFEFNQVVDIFSINDFNWNVAPSNHQTKEFELVKKRIETVFETHKYVYDFEKDSDELRFFIKNNLTSIVSGKIMIDKNNFVPIYLRWLDQIKPLIDFPWEEGKKQNILDSHFYLADLFVDDKDTDTIDDDTPTTENIFVVFRNGRYEILNKNLNLPAYMSSGTNSFYLKDKKAYQQFWKKYKRPPVNLYQQYILERKDLLVPQDIRERKGAFFTPYQWVELSQQYIAKTLGNDWQDEYFVWDCASGTGNLLVGLTNKYNIFASTDNQSDINVLHERIENGAVLLKNHCFQFDFLNDDFLPKSQGGKLPEELYKIITNEKRRKKLLIYINPPYAEATSAKTVLGTGENKTGVTTNFKIKDVLNPKIGNATNEFFALFMAVIYEKIPDCVLGQFSKLKFVNGSNFKKFKDFFLAEYLNGFVVPADTFDNVKGKFPIGFTLWDTSKKQTINTISTAVYHKNGLIGIKEFYGNLPESINKWLINFQLKSDNNIGIITNYPPDFQNQSKVFIQMLPSARSGAIKINHTNLIPISIYFSVRHCIKASWINDRDQFLYPNDGWKNDRQFQNDCLAFTLFHSQNKFSSKNGTNHWIPFSEKEVDAKARFESHFITDFIKGKIKTEDENDLFVVSEPKLHYEVRLKFSNEAQQVFDAGRELWKYYHHIIPFDAPPSGVGGLNASLYDIKEYFQGRNDKGRMSNKSNDKKYNELMNNLKEKLDILAKKLEPKVYEYGFLRN